MTYDSRKDLFYIQSDLIEMKVDMAVSKSVDKILEQITSLKLDVHALRNEMHSELHQIRNEMHTELNQIKLEMNKGFSSLDVRVTAIETKLGMVSESHREIKSRFLDYSFRAGWLLVGVVISYAWVQLHLMR